MSQRSLKGALTSILFIEALGFLSGLLSGNISTNYQNLVKPPLSPPGWLFGIAWIILYALMGLAIYRVYTSSASQYDKNIAIFLFTLQLLINLIWPIVFFQLDMLWFAAILILILDVLVFFTIRYFWKVDQLASILMVPYFIWIIFATYLNIGFALLN